MDLSRPFRVADARAHGRSRASIDSRYFEMPFHGIRAPRGALDLVTRCRAFALRMRSDAAFTGLTAAHLWGMPLPIGAANLERLHVSVPHGRPRPRSRGVIGSERAADVDVIDLEGLPVLGPVATWASLGASLGVLDLVAVGDHLLGDAHRPALATVEELTEVARRRTRGAPRLRRAVPWMRFGSASRPETLSRVLLTAGGIPDPDLNCAIPGTWFTVDLAWPAARFGIEYQGHHHDSAAQRAADIRRQELIHDEGWLLMEVTRVDLFDAPLAMLDRVARRLSERGMHVAPTNPPIWALPRR